MGATVLLPGRYDFVCKCGGKHKILYATHRMTVQNRCWYCKGEGKHIKLIDMENLDFTNNWNNKLNCNAFSTIRLRNDVKYYVGAQKVIRLKGAVKGEATIVSVSSFTLDKLNESTARIDTGYSAEECRKIIMTMYKNRPTIDWFTQQLVFCVLVYDKKEGANTPDLFDNCNLTQE